MLKYSNEELIEVLPAKLVDSRELTAKQKSVLGQLIIYSGLDKNVEGYFFRSNNDLCADCDISEHTLITTVRKLEMLGFIDRKPGSRGSGASVYKVNENKLNDYLNLNTENCSNDFSNFSNNCSTDKDIEIDKDIDIDKLIEYNINKNNIIEYNITNKDNNNIDIDLINLIFKDKESVTVLELFGKVCEQYNEIHKLQLENEKLKDSLQQVTSTNKELAQQIIGNSSTKVEEKKEKQYSSTYFHSTTTVQAPYNSVNWGKPGSMFDEVEEDNSNSEYTETVQVIHL